MLSFTVRMIKSLCIVIHGYRYDTSNDDKLRIVFFLVNANLFNEKQPTVFKCSFYAHCLTITIYFTAFSLSIRRRHIFSTRNASAFLTAITNQHFWMLMAGPRFLPNNSYRFPRHSIWNIFQRFCRFCGNQICLFRKYCFERNEFKLQFSKSLNNRKIVRVKVNRKYIFPHIYHRELKFFAQSSVLEKIKFEYSSSISLYAFHIQRSISFLLHSQYFISSIYLDTYKPNKHKRICF